MNIEALKLLAKQWFESGHYHTRTEEECNIYICAAEDATFTAYNSVGRASHAAFYSSEVYGSLTDYFDELRDAAHSN